MRMKLNFVLLFAALIATAAALAFATAGLQRPDPRLAEVGGQGGWNEVAWPLPRDQFGAGKAFECTGAPCNGALRVTFRAKIGFCNCATGVSDDDELERIGDVSLITPLHEAMKSGREITVGHMKGRSRLYAIHAGRGGRPLVLSLAFNDRCDVIVATADGYNIADKEAVVLEFLNSEPVLRWAEKALGL
jgi:hypothetical protein